MSLGLLFCPLLMLFNILSLDEVFNEDIYFYLEYGKVPMSRRLMLQLVHNSAGGKCVSQEDS